MSRHVKHWREMIVEVIYSAADLPFHRVDRFVELERFGERDRATHHYVLPDGRKLRPVDSWRSQWIVCKD